MHSVSYRADRFTAWNVCGKTKSREVCVKGRGRAVGIQVCGLRARNSKTPEHLYPYKTTKGKEDTQGFCFGSGEEC